MKDLVVNLYSDYGKYINAFRAFPYINDGLKISEKRLLYSLYLIARDKFQKSAKIIGHCIGNYHPHGESGLYGALVQMVNNRHVDGQGNFGCNIGVQNDPPAAMRYTEVRMNKDILKDCFEYIKFVEFEALELDEEPINLPVILPICLLGKIETQGMGFGYRCIFPCYKKEDLIKRLYWLITKKGNEPIIKPYTKNKVLSSNKDLKQLLTTGKAKIEFQSIYKIVDNKTILIKSIPPGRSFQSVLNKLKNELNNQIIGWLDNSTTETEIYIKILKPRMIKIEQLEKRISDVLKSSITYECHVYNEDRKIQLISIDDFLLRIYKRYINYNKLYFENEKTKIENQIKKLLLIEKIKPLLRQYLKGDHNIDEIIKEISSKLTIEQKSIKEIFEKYNIKKLFTIKTDKDELEKKKKSIQQILDNIIEYIWKEKYLRKS